MGRVRVDGIPVHFSRTDWVIERAAPCLGEHNDVVFGELLGHGQDELRDIGRRGGSAVTDAERARPRPGPLDGVRVVELASEHGALAGKILADLGAEVIVVEPPGGHRPGGSSPSSTTCRVPSAACGGGTTTPGS